MSAENFPKGRLMHPAYLAVESVVRAFTDDPEQADLRTNLIVSRLHECELLKDAQSFKGMVVLEMATK
jgi:hypothetical protein